MPSAVPRLVSALTASASALSASPLATRSTSTSLRLGRTFSSTATRPMGVATATIVGRLTDKPEVGATAAGNEYLRYTVAMDRVRKAASTEPRTNYFRIKYYGSGARKDFIAGLEKGTLVCVEADFYQDKYVDEEGKTRTAVSLNQQALTVLASARKRGGEEGEGEAGDGEVS